MSTDFNKKTVVTSGSIRPSTIDTPTDVRTRIETLDEVELIPLPYVGMIFYVINEDAYYSVKSLKKKDINGANINKMIIDSYQKLIPEDEIIELQNAIKELTEIPKIVIANKNIESEMEYLNEKTKDENVIGIIVDPYIVPANSPYSDSIFYFEYTLEFINNSKNRIDSYDKIITSVKTEDHIYLTHYHLYDGEWSYLTKKHGQSCAIERTFIDSSGKTIGQEAAKALVGKVRRNEIELKLEFSIYAYISNESIISNIELLKIPYSTRITNVKEI